jgi:hypothetical protein
VEVVAPAVTDLPGAPPTSTRVRLRLFGSLQVTGEDATRAALAGAAVGNPDLPGPPSDDGVPKADLLATF